MINSAHFAGVIEHAVETAAALSKRAANHEFDEALVQGSLSELQHTIDELRIAKSELDEAQQLLNASQARFRKLEDVAPVAIIGVNFELDIVQWNGAAEKLFGLPASAIFGKNFLLQCIPEEQREKVRQKLSAALDGASKQFESSFRTLDNQPRTMQWSAALLPAIENERDVLAICGQDITERAEAAHQRLLVTDIQHRFKNNLATVLAIAEQTLANTSSLEAFRESFRGRVIALAHVHTVLAERGSHDVPLHTLVTQALQPYLAQDGPRARIHVQSILLTAKAGQCLSIALHELTTNATKYGALTSQQGFVAVDAAVDESTQPPMLKFVWTEYGGPAVAIPQKRGVGTDLLEQVIRFELRGETSFYFDASGLKCEILIPWTSAVGTRDSNQSMAMTAAQPRTSANFATLRGTRILLVEDTALVADEMHHMLIALGCVVVGPAATFDEALNMVQSNRYDAVLLDVDLGGEKAWPIADELIYRNKPFVLTTGFACPDSLPSEFQELAYLEKPFDQVELGNKLVEALSREPSSS